MKMTELSNHSLYSGRLFHCYMLGKSICHFRGVWSILSLLFYFWWKILSANNVDPDQMPHYVVSHLGLNCLRLTFLWTSRWEWVNTTFPVIWHSWSTWKCRKCFSGSIPHATSKSICSGLTHSMGAPVRPWQYGKDRQIHDTIWESQAADVSASSYIYWNTYDQKRISGIQFCAFFKWK